MKIWAIVRRDMKKFWRNPLIIVVSILLPLVHLMVVGNAVQGQLKNLPVAVVNQDQGPYARRILEIIQAIEAGPKTIKSFYLSDPQEAIEKVRGGVYSAALVIPSDFSKRIIRRNGAEVGLFMDNIDLFSNEAISMAFASALPYLEEEHVTIRLSGRSEVLRPVSLYRKLDYDQSLIPGVVVMAIFLGTMAAGAFNLVMDRFLGVHEGYLVTPLHKRDIVLGLVVAGVLFTTVIALAVLFLANLITGVSIEGGVTIYCAIIGVIVLTALGLLGLMFVVLSRVDHPRIVGVLGGFLNVILFFPSGALYPIASFPAWLRAFAKVNPEAYAVHALRSLMFKGVDVDAVGRDLVFLFAFAGVSLFCATVMFKRTL